MENFWDFLQDYSLIPSSMKCDSCGNNMHIVVCKSATLDGIYSIMEIVGVQIIAVPVSLGHSSYFTGSHLRIPTILLTTYEIFQGSTLESQFLFGGFNI